MDTDELNYLRDAWLRVILDLNLKNAGLEFKRVVL